MQAYQPDLPQTPHDFLLLLEAGPEPKFGSETADFLHESYRQFCDCLRPGSLVQSVSLGMTVPWLFRLDYRTIGLGRHGLDGEFAPLERHTFALRFLPDYLRRADRFEMLKLIEPQTPQPYHPNIGRQIGGGRPVCVEIYPGETLVEIALSLHDLIRWRLKNLSEHDALNPDACRFGRNRFTRPFDERPLFGRTIEPELIAAEEERDA